MENKEVKLAPPWITYYRQVEALFGADPDIKVAFDEDELHIKMYVENEIKAAALDEILPVQKDFGNVSVFIEVIPANTEPKKVDIIRRAFEGNPAFSYATTIEGIMVNPINYVVFKPEVVQFWNDNLHDPHGLVSTLMEDVARAVIDEEDGVMFTTDKKD